MGARSEIELYDLKTDISEEHNVASENPVIADQMDQIMKIARTDNPEFPILDN